MTRDLTHVAMCFDSRMEGPVRVAISSIIDSTSSPSNLVIHLVVAKSDTSVGEAVSRSFTSAPCRFQLHRVDEALLADFRPCIHITVAGYLRLLLPTLLTDVDRVLYLDSDLIVRCDIDELFKIDLNDAPIAAVRDYSFSTVADVRCLEYVKEQLIEPSLPAFNSGVLVLDLRRWRDGSSTQKVVEFAVQHSDQLRLADQDALNFVFHMNWLELPARFNVQLGNLHDRVAKGDVPPGWKDFLGDPAQFKEGIFHFTGRIKPWSGGPQHPYIRLWRQALKKCVIARGCSWQTLIIDYLTAYWRAGRRRITGDRSN